jgi:type I restriction enzyme, S subunit
MDAQRFLAEFGHIANSPGGIQQLRNMIYQLAVTGSLTLQIDSDGDGGTVLTDIAALRSRLIQDKEYKYLPKLEDEAIQISPLISIPSSWRWTRLLDIGEISPRNTAVDETPASFIPMSGFSELHMGPMAIQAETWGKIKKGFTHFRNGDVVIAKITPCFENGKASIIRDLPYVIGAGTTELHVFRPIHTGVLPGYIYLFLRSPYFALEGEKRMTGTAGQKRLPTEYFATRALPLPPTTEQARIVSKVDELMALCDKLEAQQQARRKLQNNLRQSTLQAVAAATSPYELQSSWTRLEKNFGSIFYTLGDLVELKKMILELAMSGHLQSAAPHNSMTGLAPLEEIAARRLAWAKASTGQMRKEALTMLKKLNIQQLLAPDSKLPRHWQWASLLQISQVIIDCDHKTPSYSGTGIHLIRTSDIRDGDMQLTTTKKVSKESYLSRSRRLIPEAGDIFFSREAPMGEAAIIPDGATVCLGQRLMHLRLFNDHFSNRFLIYAVRSPSFQRRLQESAVGMTVKHINVSDVENLFVPVPPLVEQEHIVKIIDELFAKCDSYAEIIERKNMTSTNLATSSVSNITGMSTEPEHTPMKAPQTELIAPLRIGQAPSLKAQSPLATILARHNGEMSAKDLWQRYGGEIDAFYAQLKTEVAHGWILEPEPAEMKVLAA